MNLFLQILAAIREKKDLNLDRKDVVVVEIQLANHSYFQYLKSGRNKSQNVLETSFWWFHVRTSNRTKCSRDYMKAIRMIEWFPKHSHVRKIKIYMDVHVKKKNPQMASRSFNNFFFFSFFLKKLLMITMLILLGIFFV